MANSDVKEHISTVERTKWDKVVVDFYDHLGAGGVSNHMLATGAGTGSANNPVNTPNGIPGFTECDFTPVEKGKLSTVAWNANAYIHPATHHVSMITGLAAIATSGSWNHLVNIPGTFPGNCSGNSATVGGIRITISVSPPPNPQVDREIWIEPVDGLLWIYCTNGWQALRAVYG